MTSGSCISCEHSHTCTARLGPRHDCGRVPCGSGGGPWCALVGPLSHEQAKGHDNV